MKTATPKVYEDFFKSKEMKSFINKALPKDLKKSKKPVVVFTAQQEPSHVHHVVLVEGKFDENWND